MGLDVGGVRRHHRNQGLAQPRGRLRPEIAHSRRSHRRYGSRTIATRRYDVNAAETLPFRASRVRADRGAINESSIRLPRPGEQLPLINNARALETVRFILGEHAILSEFSAHVTWPGNREMPLHIDQWFMPHPVDPNEDYPRASDVSRIEQKCGDPVTARHPINPPVVCNVMFAITDFTIENGATRLVRGSHRSGLHPAPSTDYDVFHAEAPAGSFIVWEGRTWHAASLNTGDAPRVGITTYWTAPFIRQLLNFPYGLRPEVADDLTENERALMGFKAWETYGTSDEFGAAWARPGKDNTGELR